MKAYQNFWVTMDRDKDEDEILTTQFTENPIQTPIYPGNRKLSFLFVSITIAVRVG